MKIAQSFSMVRIHIGDALTDTLFQLHADNQPTNINLQDLGRGNFRVYFDFLDTRGVQQDIGSAKNTCEAMRMAGKAFILQQMKQERAVAV